MDGLESATKIAKRGAAFNITGNYFSGLFSRVLAIALS
jgi:hypothetical protein